MEQLRRLCLLCGALLGLLLLLPAAELLRHLSVLRPVVPEPPGVGERLLRLPRKRLSREEVQSLRRDGVLLVRGLVEDRQVLRELKPLLQQHMQTLTADLIFPYFYNGAVRVLLRDSPLGSLLSSAVEASGALLFEAPIWGTFGFSKFDVRAWHQDFKDSHDLVTAWTSITDSPHGMEFVLGSHLDAAALLQECNMTWKFGASGAGRADPLCMRRVAKDRLKFYDLKAGDCLLFLGPTFHRGVVWSSERLAISVRVVAEETGPTCLDQHRVEDESSELAGRLSLHFFSIHPWADTNMRCIQPRYLSRPWKLWPNLLDTLPSDGWVPRPAVELLRWVTPTLTHVLFGYPHSLRAGKEELIRMVTETVRR